MKGDPDDHPPDTLKRQSWRSRSAFTKLDLIPAEMSWFVCVKLQQPQVLTGICVFNILDVYSVHQFVLKKCSILVGVCLHLKFKAL